MGQKYEHDLLDAAKGIWNGLVISILFFWFPVLILVGIIAGFFIF